MAFQSQPVMHQQFHFNQLFCRIKLFRPFNNFFLKVNKDRWTKTISWPFTLEQQVTRQFVNVSMTRNKNESLRGVGMQGWSVKFCCCQVGVIVKWWKIQMLVVVKLTISQIQMVGGGIVNRRKYQMCQVSNRCFCQISRF